MPTRIVAARPCRPRGPAGTNHRFMREAARASGTSCHRSVRINAPAMPPTTAPATNPNAPPTAANDALLVVVNVQLCEQPPPVAIAMVPPSAIPPTRAPASAWPCRPFGSWMRVRSCTSTVSRSRAMRSDELDVDIAVPVTGAEPAGPHARTRIPGWTDIVFATGRCATRAPATTTNASAAAAALCSTCLRSSMTRYTSSQKSIGAPCQRDCGRDDAQQYRQSRAIATGTGIPCSGGSSPCVSMCASS